VAATAPKRPADILLGEAGESACLLGNEAIVRGALEAGIAFMAGYPGTPSSEITDGFARIAKARAVAFEYSVNEKVALELAFAAALAGARSLCAMKHLGLMVAGDPLSTIPYIGTEAGMVIVSAGDPSCHTSPNEADQRHFGPMLHIPVLDPSTPAEAHAMTRAAFELSEECKLPVLLRTTTRVAHSRADVRLGALGEPRVTGFVRDPARYVPVPGHARRMRVELKKRIAQAADWMARSGFFRAEGSAEDVVLASGAPAATTADVLREAGALGRVAFWRLGTIHPLPEAEIVARLRDVRRLLVVEELSPFLEDAILALVARHELRVKVLGKRSGHFPEEFEYEPHVIERGLFEALGIGRPPRARPAPLALAPRTPTLCPGCPHRAAFVAARSAFAEDQLFFNDIGCYTLGYAPPLRTADALLCMGAGFTLAAGVARVTGKRTVGYMGDSTFFHAGMPALLDAIKEKANVVAVVLDNEVTAMTGFQESPDGGKIEAVARALGAQQVETIDPYDLDSAVAAFLRAKAATGVSVVVVRRECPVHATRSKGGARAVPFAADAEACRVCGREESGLRCRQPVTEGYERNLARAAALREDVGPTPSIAPCATRCPLTLCVQGYAGHVAAGEYAEAAGHVAERTPLPESVCRVCDRPCEDDCVRGAIDQPVAINHLKRFVVEWAERERPELLVPGKEAPNGLRVAVVGAGAAGLSAAQDLAVRGYAVTLYDAEARPGGLLTHGIPEYRLPERAVRADVDRVLSLGVSFIGGTRLGRDITLAGLLDGHAAVLLAVGAHRGRTLDLPGGGSVATIDALGYLRAVRLGEEAPNGRRVVVVGGGNAAVDASRTAARRGATSVTVACLEPRDAMPALADEIVAAEREGVELRCGVRPVRFDAAGLWVAPIGGGAEALLAADLVVVAVGQEVDPASLAGEVTLRRDAAGLVAIDRETCRTSHERVFAGGDLVAGERTVTTAIAWGLRAAWGIDAALRGRAVADRRRPPLPPSPSRAYRPRAPSIPRRHPPELDARARRDTMDEVVGAFSAADARAEAERCLMCGRCGNCRACVEVLGCPAIAMDASGAKVAVDATWCIGCGVCEELCSNRALRPIATEKAVPS
jgi:indolepyruvate ferredoxin oxidoreductase alpha subunit